MKCPGVHCPGPHGSGGSALALLAAGAVIIGTITAHARAIEHAATDALVIGAIAAGSVLALATSALVTVLVIRVRRAGLTSGRSAGNARVTRVRAGKQSIPAPVPPERWSVSARVIAIAPAERSPERPESDAREVPAASASPRSPRW